MFKYLYIILFIVVFTIAVYEVFLKRFINMKFFADDNIRGCDQQGCGYFGAKRKGHKHEGIDYITTPFQDVPIPFDCVFQRIAKPYADDNTLTGVFCQGIGRYKDYSFKMFYVTPNISKLNRELKKGQIIGHAQDITNKYKGITNHIHLQVYKNNKIINPKEILI